MMKWQSMSIHFPSIGRDVPSEVAERSRDKRPGRGADVRPMECAMVAVGVLADDV